MKAPQYGHKLKAKAPKAPQQALDMLAAQTGRCSANMPRDKRRSRNDTRWYNWPMCGNARMAGDHADLYSGWSKGDTSLGGQR